MMMKEYINKRRRQLLNLHLDTDLKKICGSNLAIKTRPIHLFGVIWQCLAMFSRNEKKAMI